MTGSNAQGQLNAQTAATNQLVSQGQQNIDRIFQGGTYGINPVSSYSSDGSYYTAGGTPFTIDPNSASFQQFYNEQPLVPGSGKPTMRDATAGYTKEPLAQAESAFGQSVAKNGGLFSGTASSSGFNDAFYNQAGQDFLNYAQPQLNQQYNQTNQALQYKLGNQGIAGGSAQQQLQGDLTQELGNQQIGLANQALGVENNLRQQVGNQYQTLTSENQAAANPQLAAQQAVQSASTLSSPSAMPAIGQLFNNYASTYLAGQNASNANLLTQSNPFINFNPNSAGAQAAVFSASGT